MKTDDAVRNNADQFFKNPRTSANYLEFSFIDGGTIYNFPIDTDLKIKINNERYALELSLNKWQAGLLSVNSAPLLDSFVAEAESVLKQANIFLNDLALAANSINRGKKRGGGCSRKLDRCKAELECRTSDYNWRTGRL